VQGPWHEIETLLHRRLREAVAAGRPVIVDATHARRPWRLAITQAPELPAPVAWIGWWLTTPLATCLHWNRSRRHPVPEAVLKEMAAALADPALGPSCSEGMAAVVRVDPSVAADSEALLQHELARLEEGEQAADSKCQRISAVG
jgi:predicted kinase